MKRKRKPKTEQILMVMRILAWVAFIGFMIQAGAVLISFGVSCVNPEGAKNLYKGLNLYNLRQYNFTYYVCRVSFIVVLLLMKSYVCFLVIKTLSKITLADPFKMEVAQTLEKISYVLFGAWIVGVLSSAYSSWLLKITGEFFGSGELFGSGSTEEFLFMAGLVFIISQIFKRGVEIQSENELTV